MNASKFYIDLKKELLSFILFDINCDHIILPGHIYAPKILWIILLLRSFRSEFNSVRTNNLSGLINVVQEQ